jgi:hypothetical protein
MSCTADFSPSLTQTHTHKHIHTHIQYWIFIHELFLQLIYFTETFSKIWQEESWCEKCLYSRGTTQCISVFLNMEPYKSKQWI